MTVPIVDTTTSLVRPDEIPWAKLTDGIEVKLLRTGAGSGVYTLMTRFEPGIEIPTHKHFGCVHAYTIEGRWRYREYPWIAEAGSYIYEPTGSVHTLATPDDNTGPTVVIFVIESGMAYVSPDGEVWGIEDAESIGRLYAEALAAHGIEYPAQILP